MLQSMTYEVFVEVHQHSNAESGSTHVKGILSVGTIQTAKDIPMIRLVFPRTRVEEFAKQASKSAPNRSAWGSISDHSGARFDRASRM
jgi:hypothetical protein